MSEKELLEIIEESMDLDEGTLSLTDELADYEEWDSVSILSFIALCDQKLGKTFSSSDIKKIVTVEDAINMMK